MAGGKRVEEFVFTNKFHFTGTTRLPQIEKGLITYPKRGHAIITDCGRELLSSNLLSID